MRSVQQVEDDDALSSYLWFTVNKMIHEGNTNQGEKHELTNDMMGNERGEGNCEIQQKSTR